MDDRLTHASFFSGVGGLDLGLERAGWRTVSFSEIDPYASAVLADRWPGVPNLGSIVDGARSLDPGQERGVDGRGGDEGAESSAPVGGRWLESWPDGADWRTATLWTGGFPCQDLSVAGKRRGMVAGTRSGLAYSFLSLAERHRPRFVLLENVPGLLSSHGGRDMAALLGALVELGYGVGYRILDARYFGVPQRRRRVFILGDSLGGRAGAERASEVLSVGSRCRRHPPTGVEAGPGVADRPTPGVDIARAVTGTSGKRHDEDTDTLIARNGYLDGEFSPPLTVGGRLQGAGSSVDNTPWFAQTHPTLRRGAHGDPGIGRDTDTLIARIVGASPDPGGVRAPDGLAGRLDGSRDVVHSLRAQGNASHREDSEQYAIGGTVNDDPLLPLGLDSHRYRCCGNGVVSSVAEFIGERLAVGL